MGMGLNMVGISMFSQKCLSEVLLMVHHTDNWPCVSRAEAVLLWQELVFLGQKGI